VPHIQVLITLQLSETEVKADCRVTVLQDRKQENCIERFLRTLWVSVPLWWVLHWGLSVCRMGRASTYWSASR